MNRSEPIKVTCCFCGRTVQYEQATKLIVVPPKEDGGDQVLYSFSQPLLVPVVLNRVPLEVSCEPVSAAAIRLNLRPIVSTRRARGAGSGTWNRRSASDYAWRKGVDARRRA